MVDCRKLARESGRLSEEEIGRISKEIEEELAVNPSVESLREKTLNRLRQEKAELSARKVLEINQLANNVDKLKIIESKIIAGGKDKKAIVKDYGKTIRSKTKHAERHRGLVAKWKKKDLLDYLIRFYESDIENPVRIDSFQVPHLHYGLGYAYLSSVDGVSNGRDFLILAIQQFEKATQLDIDHLLAHYDLG